MNQRFQGKAALVTGAASGIGKATATRLAEEGAALALADINLPGTEAVAAELAERFGAKTVPLRFDAGDPADCARLVADSVAALGGLDVLCNIAGIMDWGPLTEFSDAAWDRILRINLSSVFHVSKHAIPHLRARRGNIVNMASAAGLTGIAFTGAYCAAKAGVIALTKSIAVEFAPDFIRANAVCPGGVDTPMNDQAIKVTPEQLQRVIARQNPKLGRMADAAEIAAAVAYLASDEAAYVTGTVFVIDGGQLAG